MSRTGGSGTPFGSCTNLLKRVKQRGTLPSLFSREKLKLRPQPAGCPDLTVRSHAAGVHRRGGGVQREDGILG